jgi:hypothetical protein
MSFLPYRNLHFSTSGRTVVGSDLPILRPNTTPAIYPQILFGEFQQFCLGPIIIYIHMYLYLNAKGFSGRKLQQTGALYAIFSHRENVILF